MDPGDKLVTVIVPFYNAEQFLQEAIASVINQSYPAWELILVDDGSTDGSVVIAKKYVDGVKVFLFQHPGGINLGVAKSRRVAINAARGELIAFLDADDLFDSKKIEKNIATFRQHPAVILVHSAANFIDSTSVGNAFYNDFTFHLSDQPYSFLDTDCLHKNPICNSSVMVKTEYLKQVDNDFNHLFQYEDWINWILLAQLGNFLYTNEKLCCYRFHENSSTSFLLRNNLTSLYAKLEMLFLLSHRVGSNTLRHKIDIAIKKQLQDISSAYALSNGNNEVNGLLTEEGTGSKERNVLRKSFSYLKSIIRRRN